MQVVLVYMQMQPEADDPRYLVFVAEGYEAAH